MGDTGFRGNWGYAGAKGERGLKGYKGEEGSVGDRGKVGKDGEAGTVLLFSFKILHPPMQLDTTQNRYVVLIIRRPWRKRI